MDPVSVTLTRVILGIWLCCQVVAEGGSLLGPCEAVCTRMDDLHCLMGNDPPVI